MAVRISLASLFLCGGIFFWATQEFGLMFALQEHQPFRRPGHISWREPGICPFHSAWREHLRIVVASAWATIWIKSLCQTFGWSDCASGLVQERAAWMRARSSGATLMSLAYELQGLPHARRMWYHYTMCPSAGKELGLPSRWQSTAAMEGDSWRTQCHTP